MPVFVVGSDLTLHQFLSSLSRYCRKQQEKQFRALNAKKEMREIKVVRDGAQQQVLVDELVVGDIISVETGDVLPADGVFVLGVCRLLIRKLGGLDYIVPSLAECLCPFLESGCILAYCGLGSFPRDSIPHALAAAVMYP